MYGVKIESNITSAKLKQKRGSGRLTPWIFEPSQSRNVGQKTIIISGVPVPARYRNGVERITRIDASKLTLFLNQRFKSKINKKPSNKPIMMLGSLMAYALSPKNMIENFWSKRYGKSTKSPLKTASGSRLTELTADSISAFERPFGDKSGKPKRRPMKARPSKI